MADGPGTLGSRTLRAARLSGYREAAFTTTPATRTAGIIAALLIAVVLAYESDATSQDGVDHGWFVALALSGVFIARGLHLRRPITLPHVTATVLVVVVAHLAYRAEHPGAGFVLLAASGFVLVRPLASKPQPEQLYRVAELVRRTEGDPLAPFALHSAKTYFFDSSSTAAIGYRTRFGVAVVAGDPIGDRAAFPELITAFSEFAVDHGWRVAVLGASPELAELWRLRALEHRGLRAVPIGRDVVLDVHEFNLIGRKFRNLRQAVSRTKNFGVSTEVVAESALTEARRQELLAIVDEWRHGRQSRGFSMILDHLLDGRNPNMLVVIANREDGSPAGFQRYGVCGRGRELSLDVPWRRKDAPNGLDERMIVDLVEYAAAHGIRRISLAFAPFPELFAEKRKSRTIRACLYLLAHLGDPLIRLESLYRFLRKFHALSDERYVLVRWREVLVAAAALLTLEFVPHRHEY
ncbi:MULTISPECIES: bifunctional lysylphosphatidylglycerol flippase/synthetase MprF [Nocardia]|uniref:bifunctional lysylphosphatidylglycerol flippase/synthetase MprF n=1 Tax=Nocardia TaxID=1817 RepID=UPI00237D7677|nr:MULTISPECIES: phosphatidylglycerol lysyltransferase domain-containing protein [Nocardia]MDE1669945.1 phosphatidylglycerol lysyltransferase domain-containing protein [Nocardia gipuzkoensis]